MPGDLDFDGQVTFDDFKILAANFGRIPASYVEGNIDLQGEVAFADFNTLAANFGQVASTSLTRAQGEPSVQAIPEPNSLSLMTTVSLLAFVFRRRVR